MLLRMRKTTNHKPQTTNHKPLNLSHRRTRFESLESRLCLSGCSISGNVYDTRFDPGEMPLAGIQIFLDDGDGIWESGEDWTISDGSGNYSFSDLQPPSYPAEYIVAQMQPAGYEITAPADPHTHTVSFASEGDATDKDFSYTPQLPTTVDLFVLSDDTGSYGVYGDNDIPWVLSLFDLDKDDDGDFDSLTGGGGDDCLIDILQDDYDSIDWGFGIGRFEDYDTQGTYNRPFILNQPLLQEDEIYQWEGQQQGNEISKFHGCVLVY